MRTREKENYGNGTVELKVDELDFLDTPEVVRRLNATFEAPGYNPPRLPQSAVKLLEMTRSPDVHVRTVTAMLEEDQMLAAEVLRISQSVQYSPAGGAPVRTLDEAIVRLGLKRTSEVFLQASLNMRVFRVKAYQKHMDQLRRHSTVVAHVARLVSRQTALFDEHVFLCGLLHDVGIAASLIAFAEATPRGREPAPFLQIWPAIRDAHQASGATLAKIWKLPSEVAFVIEHHHDFIVGGYAHPTSAVVELSNYLAEQVGAGLGHESQVESVDKAIAALKLGDGDLKRLQEAARSLAEGIS